MYIEVNHSYIGNAAKEFDNYVNVINRNMKSANDVVYSLVKKDWKHADAVAFQSKWAEQERGDSVTEKMKSSLRSQANMLRYAENQYKDAQSKAIGRSYILW